MDTGTQELIPAPLNGSATAETTANTRLHQQLAEDRAREAENAQLLAGLLKKINHRLENLDELVGGVVAGIGSATAGVAQAIKDHVGDVIRNHYSLATVTSAPLLDADQKTVLRAINRIEDVLNDKDPSFDANSAYLGKVQPDTLSTDTVAILATLKDQTVDALWQSVSAPFDPALKTLELGMRSNRVFDCQRLRQVVLTRLPVPAPAPAPVPPPGVTEQPSASARKPTKTS